METKEETFAYMKSCIKQKRAQGKESTADLYRAGSNWLRKFWGERDLHWEEITEEMVDAFEAYLKEQKLAANSRNSYLSNVRAMYNAAVKGKLVTPRHQPFFPPATDARTYRETCPSTRRHHADSCCCPHLFPGGKTGDRLLHL